jgi:hypothetical protein
MARTGGTKHKTATKKKATKKAEKRKPSASDQKRTFVSGDAIPRRSLEQEQAGADLILSGEADRMDRAVV